jgi:hypothetical protein
VLLPNDHMPNLRELEPQGQSCDGEAASSGMCAGQEMDVSAGSSHMRPAQPCSCGCGRKEGGVACEAVICDGSRAHVPEAHWDFPPGCENCERRVTK